MCYRYVEDEEFSLLRKAEEDVPWDMTIKVGLGGRKGLFQIEEVGKWASRHSIIDYIVFRKQGSSGGISMGKVKG